MLLKTIPVKREQRKRPYEPSKAMVLKRQRTAPWAKKLAFFSSRALAGAEAIRKYRNNVYAEPPALRKATRRVVVLRRRDRTRNDLKKMKMEGFKISRFALRSINVNSANVIFNQAGYVPMVKVSFEVEQEGEINSVISYPPGVVSGINSLTFCPQWPGSTLASINCANVGTNAANKPKFGLIPANSGELQDGLKWNSRATLFTYALGKETKLTQDNLDPLYTNINVFKTYCQIMLKNHDPDRCVEVYIFRVRFKEDQYWKPQDAACVSLTDVVDSYYDDFCNLTADVPRTQANRYALEKMIRAKKLPKHIKVKSCKKVFLGASCTITTTPVLDQGGQIPQKSYRQVNMRFGGRTWYKSSCANPTELITDEPLKNMYNKVDHLIIIPLPALGTMSKTGAAQERVTMNVGISIRKTNVWKEQQN